MNRNKAMENPIGKREEEKSKIPKSSKFSTVKEKSSRTVQSSKTTVKTITVSSSKEKQTQMVNHQKNVKRMSIVKLSKDVMNNFQTENLPLEDLSTECAVQVPFLDKGITTKRVLQKAKSSQTSQKQSGNLTKKPSVSNLKKGAVFGGVKFTSKKRICLKADVFETLKEEMKKDVQDKQSIEPGTKEMKSNYSNKLTLSKDVECLDSENLENTPPKEEKSSKVPCVNQKVAALKSSMAFGGIPFKPKWESTPLKPDLFGNSSKELKLFPTDSSPEWLVKTPECKKTFIKEKTEMEKATMNETVQPRTKETEHFSTASLIINETGDKVHTAFGGIRLKPKRKGTYEKPDLFEILQKEIKNNDQELHPSGAVTEQEKTYSIATKTKQKAEEKASQFVELKQPSTPKKGSLETGSPTMKETVDTPFAGIRLTPKKKSTFLKADIFENFEKEIKNNDQELPPSARTKLNTEARASKFEEKKQSSTPEIGTQETISTTMKETEDKVYTAFASLSLKPTRKSTLQKTDVLNNLQKKDKNDYQELHPSAKQFLNSDLDVKTMCNYRHNPFRNLLTTATAQGKIKSVTTKTTLKAEARCSQFDELKQSSTPETEFLETIPATMKKTNLFSAYGDICFAPKWKSTPIRPDIFDRIQKESKTEDLESYPTESFPKELKKIPDSTKPIKTLGSRQSAVEKLTAQAIQKPESSKSVSRNVKEDFAKPVPTFAGLRFKPKQKNLRDVFDAQKARIGTKAQS